MNECITSSRVRPGANVQFWNTSVSLLVSISGATQVNSNPFSSFTGNKWRAADESDLIRPAGVGKVISRANSALFGALADGGRVVAAPGCAPAKPSKTARDRSAAWIL